MLFRKHEHNKHGRKLKLMKEDEEGNEANTVRSKLYL
jgi:hypothetical protein